MFTLGREEQEADLRSVFKVQFSPYEVRVCEHCGAMFCVDEEDEGDREFSRAPIVCDACQDGMAGCQREFQRLLREG